jgi:hypothetical protein
VAEQISTKGVIALLLFCVARAAIRRRSVYNPVRRSIFCFFIEYFVFIFYYYIMKRNKIAIIIFSIIIFLMFSIISLTSFPWLFYYQHQVVAFLGIFLLIFSIPLILFILLKKKIKIYMFFYYIIYSIFTSILNIISSSTIYNNFFRETKYSFKISYIFDYEAIFLYYIFFSFQFPIIILCLLIKNIYNDMINIKYFIKNPLIYILIFSLILFPLSFFIF